MDDGREPSEIDDMRIVVDSYARVIDSLSDELFERHHGPVVLSHDAPTDSVEQLASLADAAESLHAVAQRFKHMMAVARRATPIENEGTAE